MQYIAVKESKRDVNASFTKEFVKFMANTRVRKAIIISAYKVFLSRLDMRFQFFEYRSVNHISPTSNARIGNNAKEDMPQILLKARARSLHSKTNQAKLEIMISKL
jgi:hypothetical protein